MDHTLHEELAFDISLRELGLQLATMWPVRTLPKSVDQANRQRGLPDPIGYHLHPFVLKVNIEKREMAVDITGGEMRPGSKKEGAQAKWQPCLRPGRKGVHSDSDGRN